jgi:hypothetical protein
MNEKPYENFTQHLIIIDNLFIFIYKQTGIIILKQNLTGLKNPPGYLFLLLIIYN